MRNKNFLQEISIVTLLSFTFFCIASDFTFAIGIEADLKIKRMDHKKNYDAAVKEWDKSIKTFNPMAENKSETKKEKRVKNTEKKEEKKVIEKPARKKKKKKIPIYVITVGIVIVVALTILLLNKKPSAGPPADPGEDNPIFSNSFFIETSRPVFGEKISNEKIAELAFAWKVTGQKYVYLGIFTDRIIVKDNSIINIDKNIWAWHSGLGKGREGSLYFSDGFDVINGELQEDSPPTPLPVGEYYWAIWAWDDDGITITASSKEMYFIVE